MVLPIPAYLTDQTEATIAVRIRNRIPGDLDVSTGSFIGDMIDAVAMEMAQVAIWCQATLARGMVQTTGGLYLDYLAEARGIRRKPPVAAVVEILFSGANGTVIPAGTRVATQTVAGVPADVFVTDEERTIAGGGILVPATAARGGPESNVIPGTITVLATPIDGVTSVTNLLGATGGLALESDEELRVRVLVRARNPSAGGNRGDYLLWALQVPGVGGASGLGATDGDLPPGHVKLWIVDTDGRGASQQLVDRVQEYIAAPHLVAGQAEGLTVTVANGVTIEDRVDDTGVSIKMVHDAVGLGELRHLGLELVLPEPGIWSARVKLRASDSLVGGALLRVGVWNQTTDAWCDLADGNPSDAARDLTAAQIRDVYGWWTQRFYWNGTDEIELVIARLATDTDTTVWVDEFVYVSTFSRDGGIGKAPVGVTLEVEAAQEVLVDIHANLDLYEQYDRESVETSLTAAVADYVKTVSKRTTNRTIRYNDVVSLINQYPGVRDFDQLTLNDAFVNVEIGPHQVAVLGAATWATWDDLDALQLRYDELDDLEETWATLDGNPDV